MGRGAWNYNFMSSSNTDVWKIGPKPFIEEDDNRGQMMHYDRCQPIAIGLLIGSRSLKCLQRDKQSEGETDGGTCIQKQIES